MVVKGVDRALTGRGVTFNIGICSVAPHDALAGKGPVVAPYLLNGRIAAHIKVVTANATSNEVILGVQQAA